MKITKQFCKDIISRNRAMIEKDNPKVTPKYTDLANAERWLERLIDWEHVTGEESLELPKDSEYLNGGW